MLSSGFFLKALTMSIIPSLKFLIVDDIASMRKIVRATLGQLGFNDIQEAVDGNAALSKLRFEKFDIVITDWNMPNMSGLDFLKAILGDEKLRGLPILVMTAEESRETVNQALELGCAGYIVKPFTADALGQHIARIYSEMICFERLRVLLVDDYLSMRRIMTKILTLIGVRTIAEASSGQEALDKIKTDPFDLVITDWNMPSMSGLELVRTLKGKKELGNLQIIVASSEITQQMVVLGKQAGVAEYLAKPFAPEDLKQRIARVFQIEFK
jgi:two-component system chemotaxis response regulator CheY